MSNRPLGLALVLGVFLLRAQAVYALDDLREVHVARVGSDEPSAFCTDFRLNDHQALLALNESRKIMPDAYLQFDFLPCFVQGTAQIGGEHVRWELRAGGNGTIAEANGTTIFIGCEACRKTFGVH